MNTQREIGPDIIRTLAIVCVVCGHFFTVNTPYNDVSHAGEWMLLQGCLKSIFGNLGVPLFLMLSGYFNYRKDFTLQYYKNIKRILLPYIIISLLTWAVLSNDHSLIQLIMGTLGFEIIGYAWFVEMFIGLYLLIPFINIVIGKVLHTDNKQILYGLFAILIFMTSLPPLVDRGSTKIIPNYWQACFPILLYVTGACIRHFQPQIHQKILAFIAICAIYLQYPIATYLKNKYIGGGDTQLVWSVLCSS